MCRYFAFYQSQSVEDHWKKLLSHADEKGSEGKYPIDELIQPVKHIRLSGAPEHLSRVQITDYIDCPALYAFKHIHGLKLEFPQSNNVGMGSDYGTLAHSVLEKLDFNDTESWDSFVDTLAEKNVPGILRKKLKNDLNRFKESDLCRNIINAETISREEPFAFIKENVLVRGRIDLLYGNGDKLVIVDYKTGNIGSDELNGISESYRMQIGIYALAVYRSTYAYPAKLVLHFLTPGVSCEMSCDKKMLYGIEKILSETIRSMEAMNFSPAVSDKCAECPYKRLCEMESSPLIPTPQPGERRNPESQ